MSNVKGLPCRITSSRARKICSEWLWRWWAQEGHKDPALSKQFADGGIAAQLAAAGLSGLAIIEDPSVAVGGPGGSTASLSAASALFPVGDVPSSPTAAPKALSPVLMLPLSTAGSELPSAGGASSSAGPSA